MTPNFALMYVLHHISKLISILCAEMQTLFVIRNIYSGYIIS